MWQSSGRGQGAIALGLRDAPITLEPSVDGFEYDPTPLERRTDLGYGRILRVGPDHPYKKPSDAARVAKAGDVISIAPGTYVGDSTLWRAKDLTIRGDGGIARINATGHRLVQDKAIWTIQGDNTLVENIEFTGAKSRDLNGAGIRAEGERLHIRRCYFHDNEAGLLAGSIKDASYIIEHSEFARNGHAAGNAHQIYVGKIAELRVRFNYIHDTFTGSAIKSRAARTFIKYNRIVDGRDGNSNYSIDLSNGGLAFIVGNVIQQNDKTGNYTLVTYAPEKQVWEERGAFVVHNTIVNDRHNGRFVRNHDEVPLHVYNNLFIGKGKAIEGPAVLVGNAWMHGPELSAEERFTFGGLPGSTNNASVPEFEIFSRTRLDYRLTSGSSATDRAAKLTEVEGEALTPKFEYAHPSGYNLRNLTGKAPDPGAFEYSR